MMEFAGQHPELARWIVAAVHHSDAPPDQGFLLLTWFGRLFADYRMVHGTQEVDELMLFDEGFAQKAFSLMLHLRLAADAVREYVKLVPLPDYLLMVDAPESVAYKRLDGRGWPGWIAPKGNAEKAAFLKRCLAVQDALLDGCRDRNIPVIVLDNEREDARELDRHLQTLTKRMAGEPEHG
ncbi:hypothetical protein B1C78_12840 [Thioalkalivibrio denitrificans]|uniref:Thymidylate kinase n=2 Tax=Thioalkalivibrio denitrificans TaxID=108003 RepID=A0A1V3NDQ3_9GAMM|nr:hypothetical protein B1C78_12840 [Thioalkalivibrio denitrificans]